MAAASDDVEGELIAAEVVTGKPATSSLVSDSDDHLTKIDTCRILTGEPEPSQNGEVSAPAVQAVPLRQARLTMYFAIWAYHILAERA